MKKISLLLLSVALILGASSCKKKKGEEVNNTPPSIALNGNSLITLGVGDAYTELGATATDNTGASLNVSIDASAVNTATKGVYDVLYSATDANGNTAQTKRTVSVDITDQNWTGTWSVSHNFSVCTPTANVLGTTASISIFGGTISIDHTGSLSSKNFTGTVNGQNVSLSQSQITVNDVSPLPCTYDVTASGTISDDGQTITISYNRTGVSFGANGGVSQATYTKQ